VPQWMRETFLRKPCTYNTNVVRVKYSLTLNGPPWDTASNARILSRGEQGTSTFGVGRVLPHAVAV
jgi:hypothetical protein